MTPTVEETKAMRLDLFLAMLGDGIEDLEVERYGFEAGCVRHYGGSWTTDGTKNYRDLCAARALIRSLIQIGREEAKATGATPAWIKTAGEAARREWIFARLEGRFGERL
jgi:hypothetical protein